MGIIVKELDYIFNGKYALSNVTFSLEDKECLVIQGHNGAGKTTLINCLVNNHKVDDNKIFINDIDINEFKEWDKIGFVPQVINYAQFPVSVLEFLRAYTKNNDKQKVLDILDKFKISNLKNKNIHKLSGGQKRQIFIARALLNDAKLLIFDEPLVAIDKESRIKIINILKQLKDDGIGMVIITHNFNEFKKIADKVMLLNNEVEFYGSYDEYKEYKEV